MRKGLRPIFSPVSPTGFANSLEAIRAESALCFFADVGDPAAQELVKRRQSDALIKPIDGEEFYADSFRQIP